MVSSNSWDIIDHISPVFREVDIWVSIDSKYVKIIQLIKDGKCGDWSALGLEIGNGGCLKKTTDLLICVKKNALIRWCINWGNTCLTNPSIIRPRFQLDSIEWSIYTSIWVLLSKYQVSSWQVTWVSTVLDLVRIVQLFELNTKFLWDFNSWVTSAFCWSKDKLSCCWCWMKEVIFSEFKLDREVNVLDMVLTFAGCTSSCPSWRCDCCGVCSESTIWI